MRIASVPIWAALCMAAMSIPAASAQQQTEQKPEDKAEQPIPAYRSPLASAADNGDEGLYTDPQKLVPDNRSLAGAQLYSLGELATGHTYWQPHLDFNTAVDSNGLNATTNTGWTTWTSFYGGVDLHRITGNSNLTLSYSGGASISNDGNGNNGVVQNLQVAERLAFRRVTLSLLDQLDYLPEAAFGFQTPGAGVFTGGGSIGLQPGLPPGQSILTAQGQRVSNAFVPQMDVALTPRSSLTFVGTYSVLHYFDNPLLNYYSAGIQAGYNREMTRKDTIALLYRFTAYRYSNFDQSIDDHVVQVSYGRRVTGKLAFQIAAGPEITSFAIPITGTNGTGIGTPANSSTNLYWSLNTSLTYQMARSQLGLFYSHGVGGGSGVQAGSVADTVTGNASRQFSRTFSGTATVGYARNDGLTVGVPGATTATQTFGYWTASAGLNHPMGRTMNLGLMYLLQYQGSNASFCVGPTCGSSFTRHEITFTVGWHERPIPF